MDVPDFVEIYAECALMSERYRGRWPREWEKAIELMALTWGDEEEFESPEHESLALCLSAAIARNP